MCVNLYGDLVRALRVSFEMTPSIDSNVRGSAFWSTSLYWPKRCPALSKCLSAVETRLCWSAGRPEESLENAGWYVGRKRSRLRVDGVQLRKHELRVAELRTVQDDHDWRKVIRDRCEQGGWEFFSLPKRNDHWRVCTGASYNDFNFTGAFCSCLPLHCIQQIQVQSLWRCTTQISET